MKKLIKNLPLASFIVTIGLVFSSFAFTQDTVWVYEDNGDRTMVPDCEISEDICATEYFVNPNGTLGAPTGNKEFGDRIL